MAFRVTCPNCGGTDVPGARFCRTCGSALEPSVDTALRRFVTVVRSDVQGSTGLGERHDPEMLQRVLTRYYDAARSACTYHGGMIEQIQGDAVVAIFDGHEDDALRAVRAATELRVRMTRLNEELERDAAFRLLLRTAVEAGEVVAGADSPGQLTGEVMNIVAHLEKAAGPGEIVLGETAHRLIREAVDVEEIGPLTLKGKQRPVHAYRLLVVLPGVTGRAHLAVPMVGRTLELAQLIATYERSAGDRTCQLLTLFGAAGVGKSRLIEALVEFVQPRATVLRGRCPSYGGVAYDAMIQVVADAAGLDLKDPGTARRRLAALVAGVDGAPRIVEGIGRILGLREGGGRPEDSHWALRRLLEVLARDRPLIVVLEDLHWADPALLDLVEDIAESSRDAACLLVCATRLELLDSRPRWAGGKLNAVTIQLTPLDTDHASQLVSRLLGDMATAPGVREYIVDRSGGNPLFVQGLVAMLREERLLRVDEGRWRSAVEHLEAPRDIQTLISARLMHLGAAERRVVERAAVIGRRFTRQAILALSPQAERPDVGASLRTLVRKGLIVLDPDSKRDDGYVFTHALIQEVAYHAIGKETRAELHERFADWFEQTSGGDFSQVEEVVGHHLKQAYECMVDLRASEPERLRLARRAGVALAAAGHRAALRRDIPEFAISLLRQAGSLLKDNDDTRRTTLLDLGDALRDAASPLRAMQAYREAIRAAHAAGDARRATHGALGVLGTKGFLRHEEQEEEAVHDPDAEVEDALRLFDALGDDPGLAKAWQAKAYAHWAAGRLTDAEGACRQAINFAKRAGDERLEAVAASARCFILFWGPKPLDEVRHEVEEALEWGRGRGIRRLEVDALHLLARISGMRERFPEARSLLREAAPSKRSEPRELLVLVGRYLSIALVELMAGEAAAAERALRAGREELTSLGGTGQLPAVIILLARALIMQGRDEEAMQQIRECERLASLSHRDAQIKWRAIRALLLARRGEVEAAERLAAEAVALTADWEQEDSTAEVEADHAHVLRLAGKDEAARQVAERALARYWRKGNLVGARRVEAFLGRSPVE
jgi:class 3 adenylate cyclase/tetratricopeptide (TPR) repeat protein